MSLLGVSFIFEGGGPGGSGTEVGTAGVGTGQKYDTLQSAFAAGEKVVVVVEGTYVLTSDIVIPSGARVRCNPNVIFDCDSTYQIKTAGTDIEHVSFIQWYNGKVINSDNVRGGFYLNYADNSRVVDCEVSNCSLFGICVEGGLNTQVLTNNVHDNGYGVFVYDSAVATLVSGNKFENNVGAIDTYGPVANARIINNVSTSAQVNHIHLYAGSTGCILSGNYTDNSGDYSVKIEDATKNMIEENIISKPILISLAGSDNNIVKGNVGSGGIILDDAGQDENIITENQCGIVSGDGAGGSNIILYNF